MPVSPSPCAGPSLLKEASVIPLVTFNPKDFVSWPSPVQECDREKCQRKVSSLVHWLVLRRRTGLYESRWSRLWSR